MTEVDPDRPRLFRGMAASAGVAIAPAFLFVFPEPSPAPDLAGGSPPLVGSVPEELHRFHQALDAAREEIQHIYEQALAQVGEKEAAIFQAHLLFLNDPALRQQVEEAIRSGQPAPIAWSQAIEQYVATLEGLDDPVFQARAADLCDVGQRVTSLLQGQPATLPLPPEPAVFFAATLTPSQTMTLPVNLVRGFCTVQGSATSHVVILARSLGIPAVVGLPPEVLQAVRQGETVIVDGGEGVVWLSPDKATLEHYRSRLQAEQARQKQIMDLRDQPAITLDGHRVQLGANAGGGGPEEARRALALGAEGVGLLRTEFLYMGRQAPPDEEDQVATYRAYIKAMEGRPVIFRTVDIGGDKAIPYLNLPVEANPFLGLRGLRLSLNQPELFRTQLRAILRAGAGTQGVVKIMFPMVASVDEARQAKEHLAQVRQELAQEGREVAQGVEVGIMVEIPAAALLADVLAKEVDFFSLGTNDLSQYTLAADRTHPQVGHLADALHPAVLRLVAQVVEAAHAAGRWVGVCGELAGDPLAAPVLLGLGVDELSMASASLPEVKAHIRRWSFAESQALAQDVLRLATPEEVRQRLRQAYREG